MVITMNNCSSACLLVATPGSANLGQIISVNTRSRNVPGLLALEINAETTVDGFQVDGQASLAVLSFLLLSALPATAAFSIQANAALTAITAPRLTQILTPTTVIAANPLLTVLDLPLVTTMQSLIFTQNNAFQVLSLPALQTIGVSWSVGNNAVLRMFSLPALVSMTGSLKVNSNPLLATIILSSLQTITGSLNFNAAAALAAVSFPALVSSSSISFGGCTLLSSFSAPLWSPANTKDILMNDCALSQPSVDHILARAVANPAYVSGTIHLAGGTSATPGTQGALDKATLIARGVTVTTN